MRILRYAIVALALVSTTAFQSSCNKSPTTAQTPGVITSDGLHKAAVAIEGVATTNDALIKTLIAENRAGIISDDVTRNILNNVCNKVAGAVVLTSDLTLQYTSFPADAKPKLAPLVQPILDALNQALGTGLTGIKDPTILQNIRTALLSIQAAMLITQAALGEA